MIRQVRTRLFLTSSALLILIAIVAAVALRDHLVGVSVVELVVAAVAIAFAAAAVLAWVVGETLRADLRELVTTARTHTRAGHEVVDESDDVDDWVHDMAADAEQTRAALGRERALLSSVLETLSDGVIVLDAANRIQVMNDAARRMLGLTTTPIGEVLIDVVRAPVLIELIRAPRLATAEIQLRPELRAIARINAPPDSATRVLIVEDVTAVRRLETIRRDFVANVSHELRTPVTIIRANAETLIGGAANDPEMSTKLLDSLHRNAERLARILADLLDLSRIEAGQFRLDRASVEVRAASEAAIAAIEPSARERGVEVQVDVDDAVIARADARALDHVLVNLVDNAVKYGNKGGHVWVKARSAEGRVRIEISDDGPGIAPKHRERIFERFYRVDHGRAREAGGTGLGLAIVKHLVESMDGEVGIEPNSPQGTRFRVDLPAATS